MRHRVVVQPSAEEDIEAAYLYLVEHASMNVAVRWFNDMEREFDRVLFTIEASEVLHVRHGSRRTLSERDAP